MFNNPPPQNHAVYETMWKNIVEPGKPQMTIQYGAYVLHAECLRLQTHTLKICNTYCFSTATMVTQVPQCYLIHTLSVWFPHPSKSILGFLGHDRI